MTGYLKIIIIFLAGIIPAFAEPQRIVTAGAAVTEIVAGLGLGDRLVAVDSSSKALVGMQEKPDIGYVRMLGAEGVLSQKPDLVIVSSEAGPAPVLQQIREAGVEVVVVNAGRSLDNVDAKISQVAQATGRVEKGAEMQAEFSGQLGKLREAVAALDKKPSVVFLHARGGNNLMAAGTGTAAHAMIEAAGGTNACEGFEGYKPLSAEAFAGMAPDFVLVSESVLGSTGELLETVPGLAQTPAGKNGRILKVEDAAFLGFGPRSASAARLVTMMFAQP
jgi:iron complex transport system substrate-binding protein